LGRPTPSHRRRRAIVFSLLAVLALVLTAVSPASANFFLPDAGGSPNADDIQDLYAIVRAVAAQIRGNTRLEIGWTVGAALILVVLALVTFIKLPGIDNPPNSTIRTGTLLADATRRLPPDGKSLNICVNGQQYIWRYTYQTNCAAVGQQNLKPFSYEEMVVPSGVTVTLDIVSQDVAHSWWIPNLGGKFDAIPGYTNHTWFQVPVDKYDGHVFSGQCAELCGRNHADMTARVLVLSYPDWKKWLTNQTKNIAAADVLAQAQRAALAKQTQAGKNTAAAGTVTIVKKKPAATTTSTTAAPSPNAALLAQGKTLFTGAAGCGGCHTLSDAGATGQVGPNLDDVLKGQTPAFINTSIVNPDAVIAKGYSAGIMPKTFATSLTKAQLKALVTYLAAVTSK
jgi:cytochrome c oxidase subunit 2